MQDFEGKVAVITGAGRGIGRGIALRCAREGMKIVLAGYGMESITKTQADLEAMGAETHLVQTDVSVEEQVEHLANESFERFGAVHLLVNNAGVVSPGSIFDISMNDWNWVMGVNFYGVLYGIRAFVPRMMQQEERSHVVSVASAAGVLPTVSSYGVTKHAVVSLSEALFSEMQQKESRVGVSVYCPAWVSTEFDTVDRSRPERFTDSKPSVEISDEMRAGWRKSLESGVSIEESADILFDGLQRDSLYIGIKGFAEHGQDNANEVLQRAQNIVNEDYPANPNDSED